MFFNSKVQLISRQVLLNWKQLGARCYVITQLGQNWKFVRQNLSVKPNCSLIRCVSMSSACQDVKQLTSETVWVEDETHAADILANLSPENEKRLKVLKLEYDVFMSTGVRVPEYVSGEDWVHILYNCQSPSSREMYYKYLFKRENAIEASRLKREANRLAHEEKMKRLEQMKLDGNYDFLNSYRLCTHDGTISNWYNNNLYYAVMNGPHLVFDMSFEDEMADREIKNLVRQVKLIQLSLEQ